MNTKVRQIINPLESVQIHLFPNNSNASEFKILYELQGISEKGLQIVYKKHEKQSNQIKIKFDRNIYKRRLSSEQSNSRYWTFPPPTKNYGYFKLTYPLQCSNPRHLSIGIFQFQANKALEPQKTIENSSTLRQHWMYDYFPLIKHLKIAEMALLSAHDSASFNFYNIIALQWAVTQNQDFIKELRSGIRVLDLRICQQNLTLVQQIQFKLCHARFQTTNTIKDVIRQAKQFIQQNPNEILIFDLHQTQSLNYKIEFNHWEFDRILRAELGDLILKASDIRELALGQILDLKGRIILSYWHGYYWIDSNTYMQKIRQIWTKKIFICQHTIERYFTKLYQQRQNRVGILPLWSASINLYLFPTGPTPIDPGKLEEYFIPGQKWMNKTQIVQIDFVEESYLIYEFIFENIKRAFSLQDK